MTLRCSKDEAATTAAAAVVVVLVQCNGNKRDLGNCFGKSHLSPESGFQSFQEVSALPNLRKSKIVQLHDLNLICFEVPT